MRAAALAATWAFAVAHSTWAEGADISAKPEAIQKSRLAALVRSQTRTPPQQKALPLAIRAAAASVKGKAEAARQAWSFEGKAGELVTVEVDSEAFDPMYFVTTASPPYEILDADDDSGPHRSARVRLELPKDGTYLVRSGASEGEGEGAYELRLAVEPPLEFRGSGALDGRYALLVGIDDYPSVSADLKGPVSDVALVKELLIERFGYRESDVLVLTNERATRRNLIGAIRNHLGQAGPEGSAFLFFSGHGVQLAENLGIQDDEEDGVDEAWYLANGTVLLDDEFALLSANLATDRLTVVVDSCHSGSIFRGIGRQAMPKGLTSTDVVPHLHVPTDLLVAAVSGEDPSRDEGIVSNPKHLFLAASAADQRSWAVANWDELEGSAASVFTFFLVRNLAEVSLERSFGEVMGVVGAQTSSFAKDELGQRQDPTISSGPSQALIRDRLSR